MLLVSLKKALVVSFKVIWVEMTVECRVDLCIFECFEKPCEGLALSKEGPKKDASENVEFCAAWNIGDNGMKDH